MRARTWIPTLLAPTLLLAACGQRGTLYTEALKPLPLLATPDAIVSVVPVNSRLVLVRPDGTTPVALRISQGARQAALSPQGEVVAVLAGTPQAPVLDLVTLASGAVDTVATHGLFDEVSFSPDGSLAVLTYAATARVPGLAARNLNEVDVVDVAARTATRLQLDTDSLAPRAVVFAPRSGTRQLVAVTFDKGVALFDALRPALAARRIAVRPAASTAEVSILEALFAPDARFLFLRAQGLDDVVVAELQDTGERIEPSLNFLAGGVGLTDLELPLGAGQQGAVLAVFATSQEALLLDARGNEDQRVRLELPGFLTRAHARPDGKVLLYDGGQRSVAVWDPASGKSGVVALDATFSSVVFADPQGRVVFEHRDWAAALTLGTVEEEPSRLRLKLRSVQLSSMAEGPLVLDGLGHLFFANRDKTTGFLVKLDLGTLELSQLALEEAAVQLFWLGGTGRVAALHSAVPGSLTFVDAETLDRASSRQVQGWTRAGELDRPEDN